MNKEKILNWVKANKKSVGIIGGALVGVLLIGGGYGIYKYTSKPSKVVENSTLPKQEATGENTSDNSNENKDGEKDNETNGQVDNQENTSNNKTDSNTTENKQENKDEKSSSSENNKNDVNQGENKTSAQDGKSTITTESGNKQTNSSNTNSNVVNKPANKPNGNTNPSHSHSWTPITKVVHHKEQGHYENVVIKPAWTEKVPVYEEKEVIICNDCGEELSVQNRRAHVKKHILNGGKGSWREEWKKVQVGSKTVKHEAVYKKKWVVDKKAYDETVTTGYKCSCGATK